MGIASKTGSPVALVTGGNGFLGRHIVEHLLSEGKYTVKVFDIRPPSSDVEISEVEYVSGDLRRYSDVASACQQAEVVFHVATASPTGANAYNKDLMKGVNVDGTRNVIKACVDCGVQALVYTSSASVVFDGNDLNNVNESTPYASKPLDFYTQTKIDGEKLILEANGLNGLATCALRPSGIFGEYDPLLVPTAVEKAKAGKMKFIVGSGENKMDWTYAGNVAEAHLLAANLLCKQGVKSAVSGKAYFITNDDPRLFWGFMGDICEGLGYGRPHVHLPFLLIMFIANLVQFVVVPLMSIFGKRIETDFTPFRMRLAAANRTFDCKAAKKDLGYIPTTSVDEGMKRTLTYFSHLRHDDSNGKSKKKK